MTTWEVTYSVFSNNINESGSWTREAGMPSQFTTQVSAPNQSVAESMVKSMNGGSNHCVIRSCRNLG